MINNYNYADILFAEIIVEKDMRLTQIIALLLAANTYVLAGLSPVSYMFEDSENYSADPSKEGNDHHVKFLQTVFNFSREGENGVENFVGVDSTEDDIGALKMMVEGIELVSHEISNGILTRDSSGSAEGDNKNLSILKSLNVIFKTAVENVEKKIFDDRYAEHLSIAAQLFTRIWRFNNSGALNFSHESNSELREINANLRKLIGEYEDENDKAIREIYHSEKYQHAGTKFTNRMRDIAENSSDTHTVKVSDYIDAHVANYLREKLEAGDGKDLVVEVTEDVTQEQYNNFMKFANYLVPENNKTMGFSVNKSEYEPFDTDLFDLDKKIEPKDITNLATSFSRPFDYAMVHKDVDKEKIFDVLNNKKIYSNPDRSFEFSHIYRNDGLGRLYLHTITGYYQFAKLDVAINATKFTQEFILKATEDENFVVLPKKSFNLKIEVRDVVDIFDNAVADKANDVIQEYAPVAIKHYKPDSTLLIKLRTNDNTDLDEDLESYLLSKIFNAEKLKGVIEEDAQKGKVCKFTAGTKVESKRLRVTEIVSKAKDGTNEVSLLTEIVDN